MRSVRAVTLALLLGCLSWAVFGQQDPWAVVERKAGSAAVINAALREEAWFVPGGPGADSRPTLLKARVFRPPGDGPFKLAIVSHGSPPSAAARPAMAVPRYASASAWLLERGYMVVMPLRRGYGEHGPWMEHYGTCNGADYVMAGNATADDILAAAGYMRAQPMVRPDRILLVGVSAGGWGTVAAASRNPEGVFAVLNFSGGRGGHQGRYGDENCAPGNLVKAAGVFGRGARVPSLWLYARNDTFFDGELSRRMFEAFKGAGGNGEYVLFPDFKKEGHNIFGDVEGRRLWAEPAANFLQRFE
jgi:dienelactone hydrolase